MSNNADSASARELNARTGMKHTEALAHVVAMRNPPTLRHPWQISDELRAWLHGETWRGSHYRDLYGAMDKMQPEFECNWCGEPGDARTEPCAVRVIVTSYDPDLHPRTEWIGTNKYHARCKPSGVDWTVLAAPDKLLNPSKETPVDAHLIGLPASGKPSMVGEFAVKAWPFLSEDEVYPPVLFITATVTKAHKQPKSAWINELEFLLRNQGFMDPDTYPLGVPPQWSMRIFTESLMEGWLAVRDTPPETGKTPDHFFVGKVRKLGKGVAPDFGEWAARAHRRGMVWAVFGPITVSGERGELDLAALSADELEQYATGDGYDRNEHPLHVVSRPLYVADPADPTRLLPVADTPDDVLVHGEGTGEPTGFLGSMVFEFGEGR